MQHPAARTTTNVLVTCALAAIIAIGASSA